MKLLFSFSLLLLFSINNNAQTPKMHFVFYGINDGLSASTIDCIFKDARGFLWLGTQDGLNRYDGYEFGKYYHKNGDSTTLGENYVKDITDDKDGNLWICSYSGGISNYLQHTNIFNVFKHNPKNKNSIIDDRTVCVMRSSNNKIWIGTEHGLSIYDIAKKSFSNFFNASLLSKTEYSITSICEAVNHHILVTTTSGNIIEFTDENNNIQYVAPRKINSKIYNINKIVTATNGNIYIGTNDGLYCFLANNSFKEVSVFKGKITNKIISALACENDSILWIGTETNGLLKLNIHTQNIEAYTANSTDTKTIKTNFITALYCDDRKNLWVGTDAGLNAYFPFKEKFTSINADAKNDKRKIGAVWSICSNNNCTVLGTSSDLLLYNNIAETIEKIGGAATSINKNYYCIYKNKKDFIVGTSDGIIGLKQNTNSYITYHFAEKELLALKHKKVCTILEKDSNCLWIGTYEDGLYCWNRKQHTLFSYAPNKPNSIASEVINTIFKDKDGVFWFGTDNGLSYYQPQTNSFINIEANNPSNKSPNRQYVYYFYDDGTSLWIATYGGGLNCMNKKTKQFTYYTTENGLVNNDVYCIVPDAKNNLWLSTNNGISCFNIITKQFKNYNEYDGTQSNEFNHWAVFKNNNNEIFFGGINGVTQINPDNIQSEIHPSPLQITNVNVMGIPYISATHLSDTKTIELNYTQNKLSFQFAALSFVNTQNNQYKFRLIGLEKDWNAETNEHSIAYNNLSPGEYVFEVVGANHDGIWNSKAASITILIHPPFYATWWFKSLVILAIAALLYAFYKYRINQILAMQKIRNRIAQDLHDDVGATLGSINIFSQVAKNKLQTNTAKSFEALENIEAASKEIIEKVSDIVWTINPSNDSNEALVNRMKAFATKVLQQQGIQHNFNDANFDVEQKLTMLQRKNIFLIYKEALHNIVKYANCSEVNIAITTQHKRLRMLVTDDGCGFDANNNNAYNGNGIKNMRSRAKEINGSITISAIANKGTTVQLEF